jgi:hypothetical protein
MRAEDHVPQAFLGMPVPGASGRGGTGCTCGVAIGYFHLCHACRANEPEFCAGEAECALGRHLALVRKEAADE